MQLFTFSQRVTYLENPIIRKSDNISRIGFINRTLTLSHELSGRRETDNLALTHMQIGLIADKLARADLTECNTTAVIGVDIGSNLENKTSGAMRMYWVYGPDKKSITIIGLEPHPEDKKNGAYERITLSELPPVEKDEL